MVRANPKRRVCVGNVKDTLKKMNYALVGGTSAVQVCRWTKNALRGDRGCWKEKFYGISSAGCCQMSPAVMWCENQCLHCWRPIELNLGSELPCVDDPVEILDGIVAARKKLLEGFRGRKPRSLRWKTAGAGRSASPGRSQKFETSAGRETGEGNDVGMDLEKLERAMEPSLYTMSLSGEATLYPRLGEMFAEIRKRGAVSFLVTNGLNPSVIAGFKEDELPTQITISMNAPNEDLFKIWHRSSVEDAWGKFNESLDVIRELKGVRRVVRLTLVDVGDDGEFNEMTNMSEENVGEYCVLIRKAAPDFVHVKGYKSVGYARARMGYDKQPWFDAVKDYAIKILEELNRGKVHALRGEVHASHGKVQSLCDRKGSSRGDGDLAAEGCEYEIAGEDERCCVVMLAKKGMKLRIERV